MTRYRHMVTVTYEGPPIVHFSPGEVVKVSNQSRHESPTWVHADVVSHDVTPIAVPLTVGATVRTRDGRMAQILSIRGDWAWLEFSEYPESMSPATYMLASLEHAERDQSKVVRS